MVHLVQATHAVVVDAQLAKLKTAMETVALILGLQMDTVMMAPILGMALLSSLTAINSNVTVAIAPIAVVVIQLAHAVLAQHVQQQQQLHVQLQVVLTTVMVHLAQATHVVAVEDVMPAGQKIVKAHASQTTYSMLGLAIRTAMMVPISQLSMVARNVLQA
jgi:type III secretory pathway component EscU